MMTKDIFNKITSIRVKIENSLKDEDFVSISELSKELDQSVRMLTETLKSQQFTDTEKKKIGDAIERDRKLQKKYNGKI